MEIVDSVHTSLRAIGRDEYWIRDWIVEKPSRLGLGDLEIQRHDLVRHENHGARLDVLAFRKETNTFYEIEIMLDECPADHGVRTLAFWSRERLKHPGARHVAVLVSEDLSCRYRALLEGLPQVLPFIGIEIKVLKLPFEHGLATVLPFIVVQSHNLGPDTRNIGSPLSATPFPAPMEHEEPRGAPSRFARP